MATSLQNFVPEKCFRNLVFSAILINRFNCFRIKYCFALYGLILLGPSWKLVSKYQIIQSISERLPIAFKFVKYNKICNTGFLHLASEFSCWRTAGTCLYDHVPQSLLGAKYSNQIKILCLMILKNRQMNNFIWNTFKLLHHCWT